MKAFRILLAVIFIVMFGYTVVVIANDGLTLVPIFFGDIAQMGWPGQFNLDFLFFLLLSALWVSWRYHFSPIGIVLGVGTLLGGAIFFSAYLFIESLRVEDDVKLFLLGRVRANQ